jgi:uncharacterized membrane protein
MGMTAAVYFTLTVSLSFMSYQAVQFRISEAMNLLVFINPVFAPGVILGCLLANLFSPFGPIDALVGTALSAAVLWGISRTKNLFLASLYPVFACIFIALEIFLLTVEPPAYSARVFFSTALSVMGGEAAVMLGVAYPLFRFGILKNERLTRYLKAL